MPATSANLGPGFDAFGLALTLYDELTVTPGGSGVTVEVVGPGAGEVALDESHLVVRAIRAGLDSLGASIPGFTLRCENRIPHGRGLGSSSAAIVGGLAAAYGLAGTPLDRAQVVALANEIEGHPDNVAAAALGGFTIAWTEADQGRAIRLEPVAGQAVVVVCARHAGADERGSRVAARRSTAWRCRGERGPGGLAGRGVDRRPELLLTATEDRLHQDYREPAMPESLALVHKLRGSGLPAVISGAGPTVLVLGSADDLPAAPDGWSRYDLAIDPVGVQVWSGDAH